MVGFTKRVATLGVLTFLVAIAQQSVGHAELRWHQSTDSALAASAKSGKPILVFVTAEWCHFCKKMKKETWSDPNLQNGLSENFETLVVDADSNKALVEEMQLRGFPATLIYDPQGGFIAKKAGFMKPEKLTAWINHSFENTSVQ